MARAPARACTVPGCGELLAVPGRCGRHREATQPCRRPACPGFSVFRGLCALHLAEVQQATEARRESANARGYGAAWRQLRAHQLRREPRCRTCGARATEVDHVRPRRAGGSDELVNLQSLCRPCHASKTQREASRARGGRSARP